MFRLVSFIIFLLVFGWLAYRMFFREGYLQQVKRSLIETYERSLTTCKNIRKAGFSEILRYCLLPLLFICVAILACTGFFPAVLLGQPMAGYLLVLHFAAAPFFAFCVAALSLAWPYKHRFDGSDWSYLLSVFARDEVAESESAPDLRNPENTKAGNDKTELDAGSFYRKLFYWLLLLFSVPVILSVLASMYPLFGSIGQAFLLDLHRYSALALVLSAMGYFHFFVMGQEGN